jgi:hypothetical protein
MQEWGEDDTGENTMGSIVNTEIQEIKQIIQDTILQPEETFGFDNDDPPVKTKEETFGGFENDNDDPTVTKLPVTKEKFDGFP